MDSFEWNKIFGALLGMAALVLGVNFGSDMLFHADKPETPGYAIEGGALETTAVASGPAEVESVNALLASADLAAGEKAGRKCVACHTFDEGGANKVGPALYGVVDRAIAAVDGFGYSAALKAYGEGKTWTYDELNGFLYKPKDHVKGTSMGFAGLKKTDERAAMIAYLRSLAATPAPLPAAEEAPATDAAADGNAAPAADAETEDGTAPAADNAEGNATTGEAQPEAAPADTETQDDTGGDTEDNSGGDADGAADTENQSDGN